LEEFIKENKQNLLKSSSRSSGRILLPNPYPKKNSHRSSFATEENENQKQQEKENSQDENPQKNRKNSFSIEEFKEYNKKFQGKQLSERLDMISQEFEDKVIGDLKKIEDKISEPKPPNLVILKTNLSPRNKTSECSMSRNLNEIDEKTKINNTSETLNERYVSLEKKDEKISSILNKKTFSSNSKDKNMDLEYSPFTNKMSNENSRSYILGTQSQKKELIKESSNWGSSAKKPNVQEINKKIRQDLETSQKKGEMNMKKKKDFLIQTNLSPSNQDFMFQFRNLSVSPIDNGSVLKENNIHPTKINTSEKKQIFSGKEEQDYSAQKDDSKSNDSFTGKKKRWSEKKEQNTSNSVKKQDQICQANFESFDQYFDHQHSLKKEKNVDEEENFNSIGEPIADPSKHLISKMLLK
jgi:hypothetical protein